MGSRDTVPLNFLKDILHTVHVLGKNIPDRKLEIRVITFEQSKTTVIKIYIIMGQPGGDYWGAGGGGVLSYPHVITLLN